MISMELAMTDVFEVWMFLVEAIIEAVGLVMVMPPFFSKPIYPVEDIYK